MWKRGYQGEQVMPDFQQAELCLKGRGEQVMFIVPLGRTLFTSWGFKEKLSDGLVNQ